VNRDLTRVFSMVTSGDAAPASEVRAMAMENCKALVRAVAAWKDLAARARTLEASLGGRSLTLPDQATGWHTPVCGG
jgi:hypothetical protein